MNEQRDEKGIALLSVVVLLAFLTTVLVAYFLLSDFERSSARSTMDVTRGYYAAEAVVNMRLDGLRSTFLGYNRPAGTSPAVSPGELPCQGGALGSGDFACQTETFSGRTALSLINEAAANPFDIVIPRGELYQNLRAQEYRYVVRGVSVRSGDRAEAVVDMNVDVRLVPLFQFAAFYNKDLEILPGPTMSFEGPVHSNGNLYMDAGTSLTINGQVSTAARLYLGRKDADSCNANPVRVYDPASPRNLPACGGTRREILESDLGPWNSMIKTGVETVVVPPPEDLDPVPGALYWDRADLRIVLDVNGAPAVQVRDAAGTTNGALSAALNGCGSVNQSTSFFNHREGSSIRMLNVDVAGLLSCIHANPALMGGKALDDGTDGGLVLYLGVDGPDSATINNYGVRVAQGSELASSALGAPTPRGLTVVTDQALYVQGDYNSVDKKPAAFLCDSLNILSNDWDDADSAGPLGSREAASTTINAAFLAGTDTTGSAEGTAGEDSGEYNGGLENYPRLHEDWSGKTLTYRGSFVSLGQPRHVDGTWGSQSYSPPNRDWHYDSSFDDADGLPPLSPRFVHVVQGLFGRQFEL